MNKTNPALNHGSGHAVSLAETENAIEIAMNCLEFLQERINLGRDAIIRNYIIPWAHEAETAWKALQASGNPAVADTPSYDFIDAFSQNKQAEFLQGQLS